MKRARRKAGEFYDPNSLLKKTLLRVDEAASLLDVHANTVRRYIEAEKLPAIRTPGGQLRIRTGALTRFL